MEHTRGVCFVGASARGGKEIPRIFARWTDVGSSLDSILTAGNVHCQLNSLHRHEVFCFEVRDLGGLGAAGARKRRPSSHNKKGGGNRRTLKPFWSARGALRRRACRRSPALASLVLARARARSGSPSLLSFNCFSLSRWPSFGLLFFLSFVSCRNDSNGGQGIPLSARPSPFLRKSPQTILSTTTSFTQFRIPTMDFLGPLVYMETNSSRNSINGETPLANDRIIGLDDDEHNSSTASNIYSADEQIIRQRGRRSPQKSSLDDYEQVREQYSKIISSNRNLFTARNQSTNVSPPSSQQSRPAQSLRFNLNSSISSSKSSQSIDSLGSSVGHSRRKSLLRTPIKKRLKRNANVLSQLRKSNKRRSR